MSSYTITFTASFFVTIICLVTTFNCWGGTENLPINILMIHSYSEDLPWTMNQHLTFKQKVQQSLPSRKFNFFVQYLDTKKTSPTETYKSSFKHYIHNKFSNSKIDLIYTSDDNATNFVFELKAGSSLFPDVPLIFSGVNNLKLLDSQHLANTTGVFENHSTRKNIELLITLQPDVEKILLVGDNSPSANAIQSEIENLNLHFPMLDIVLLNNSKLSVLLSDISAHPNAPIIFTAIGALRSDSGEHIPSAVGISKFSPLGRILIVTTPDFFTLATYPVLGGYITTPEAQATAAAKLAAQVLKGTKAGIIPPITHSPVELLIDYKRLDQLKLSIPTSLRGDLRFINKPASFWIKNPNAIFRIMGIVSLIFFIALSFFIFSTRKQHRIIKEQATDSLTGLPNRTSLIQHIRAANFPTIAILDIEGFNSLNNFYGLETCDAILCHVAQSLSAHATDPISVYRLGNDIFVLLADKKEYQETLKLVTTNIVDYFSRHDYKHQETNIRINLSAGISGHKSMNPLIDASIALNQAKKERSYIVTYTEEHANVAEQQRSNVIWVQKLRDALREDRVKPFFQVIVDNVTGDRSKVEALVRLIEPNGKIIPPFFFLEAAKISRQYYQITHIMIEKSLQEIANNDMTVSINFTIEDTQRIETVQFFKEQLAKYSCASRVIIELTESEGIENYDDAIEFIRDIRSLGAKVAIDDFGSGYSNFMHLMSLNPDFLKIDGSIVKRLLDDRNAEVIVKALVNFANELGIKTIAEFVDSQALQDKVTELGVDYSQGYHLGKPAPGI
ncbi:MAG: bifunctional diguanylate cyclase/phosphodiesterase [Oceanospirillaceae bacterium]|nr:bifunctional diguanylate cyclase/phosphodiesterase [Oceanospirillaceae bacterium]